MGSVRSTPATQKVWTLPFPRVESALVGVSPADRRHTAPAPGPQLTCASPRASPHPPGAATACSNLHCASGALSTVLRQHGRMFAPSSTPRLSETEDPHPTAFAPMLPGITCPRMRPSRPLSSSRSSRPKQRIRPPQEPPKHHRGLIKKPGERCSLSQVQIVSARPTRQKLTSLRHTHHVDVQSFACRTGNSHHRAPPQAPHREFPLDQTSRRAPQVALHPSRDLSSSEPLPTPRRSSRQHGESVATPRLGQTDARIPSPRASEATRPLRATRLPNPLRSKPDVFESAPHRRRLRWNL